MSNNRDLADLGKSAEAIDVDASAPADSLAIDSSGKVGIGTSSPFSDLHLGGGHSAPATSGNMADNGLTLSNGTGGRAIQIGVDDASARSYIQAGYVNNCNVANHLSFLSGANESMRIDSSGDVFIGTTSQIGPADLVIQQSTSTHACIGCLNTGGAGSSFLAFANAANQAIIGSIKNNGNTSTSYNTTSDYRLKENVVDIDGAIDRVKALQPRRFNFIANADTTVDGFLAHEVSDIVPEAISGEKDATKEEEYEVTPAVLDDDGNVVTEAVMGTRTVPDYQGIDQSKLVPLLTGALQEAIAKIEALETRIEALENV